MVWNTSAFQLLIISASGGFTGLFEYSPVPGHGNLIASIAPSAGTDPYGNAYQQGIVSYAGSASSLLNAGVMQLASTVFQSSPANFNVSGSAGGSAQLNITSGVGTEAGAAGSTLILGDSGANTGGLQVINGADSNTYDTERLTLISPGVTINTITAPGTTIFSHHLGKGTYEIEVWLVTQNTTAADNAIFQFSGITAGAPTLLDGQITQTGASVAVNYFASSTYSTAFSGQGVAGNQRVHVLLTLTLTAAGTLLFSGAESVAGNTVTVSAGSRMRICPVVAT